MATFHFILGMVVVLVIAEVIAVFMTIKTTNSLKEQINPERSVKKFPFYYKISY